MLRIVPLLPAAPQLDKRWQQGVPDAWPAVGEFLRERTAHDFPVLSRIRHARVIKSVASPLRENPNPATTVVGLDAKVLAGIDVAEVVADRTLGADVRALAARHGVAGTRPEDAARFAVTRDAEPPGRDQTMRAALLLARAAPPSPAEIDAGVVAACRDGGLSAPAIVELVSWIFVLQMLHRFSCYRVSTGAGDASGDPGTRTA